MNKYLITPIDRAFEFRRELWGQKTRVTGLSYGIDPTFSRFDTIPECDTHTQRDRQTDGR